MLDTKKYLNYIELIFGFLQNGQRIFIWCQLMLNAIPDFFKKLTWILILASILISTVVTCLVYNSLDPYEFDVLESALNTDQLRKYHDFNHDGFSEILEITLRPEASLYFIQIKNSNGGIIDQTNYWESFLTEWIMYEDITGDDFDELITFTEGNDSLFIYVHDIKSKKTIINRLYIDCLQESRNKNKSYAKILIGFFANKTIYENNVIIFGTNSYTSLWPRNIYALDLDNKSIIKQFNTHACLSHVFPYDITGDGIDEVIAYSVAYANVPYPAKYSDDKCWLFVLDQQLNPIFPPLSFSEYPSEFVCTPLDMFSERFILVVPFYLGEKKLERMIYLIDSKGKIYQKKQNPFGLPMDYGLVSKSSSNPSQIFGWQGKSNLIKLNHELDLIKKVETPFNKIKLNLVKDLNNDGIEELIYYSENFLSLFNNDLEFLAKYEISYPNVKLEFCEKGLNNPLEIGLEDSNNFYHLALKKNKIYSFIPLIFVFLCVLVFMILKIGNALITVISIQINIFKFFIYNNSNAILVSNKQGKILKTNNKLSHIFNLPQEPLKGDYLSEFFHKYPQIIDNFDKCIEKNKQIELFIKSVNNEILVNFSPWRLFKFYSMLYFVEFQQQKFMTMSEKIQSWSSAVQKMAHDIKTPLSTVALNIKVLENRLKEITIEDKERSELSEDLEMIRTELENIHSMTKNFLKFSNLEKPHFQVCDISKIINNAFEKYKVYFNQNLIYRKSIDKDVKPVWADPQQIEMVIHILMENALCALKGKGQISIDVCLAQYLDKSFSDYIEIEVADSGPGISENDKTKVFEPYYTTKNEGTGIGLAIAKKIIEDHSGAIEVYSKANFGAVFRFSIPVFTEEGNNEQ